MDVRSWLQEFDSKLRDWADTDMAVFEVMIFLGILALVSRWLGNL